MRKSLIAAALLLGLGLGGVCGAYAAVDQARDAVSIQGNIVLGDRAALEGLSLTCTTYADSHLLWTTRCAFDGALSAETEFSFSPNRISWPYEWTYDGITVSLASCSYGIGGNGIDLEEEEFYDGVLTAPAADVASRTPAGERRTEQLLLKDYYEYYPLQVDSDFPRGSLVYQYQQLKEVFSDTFRIPVDEDHRVEVTVEKDDAGQICDITMNTLEGGAELECSSVYTEGGCYFTLACYTYEEQEETGTTYRESGGVTVRVPTKIYRGGQRADTEIADAGIWFFPAPEEGVDLDQYQAPDPELVYPLGQADVRGLELNADGSQLLLITREDGWEVLTVIDRADMTQVQQFRLFEAAEDEEDYRVYGGLTAQPGWLLVQATDGSFVLLAETGDGRYEERIRDTLRPTEDWGDQLLYQDGRALAYDGERLAVAANAKRHSVCGFYLVVYDGSGLLCAGEYTHSQDTGQPRWSNERCRPADVDGLALSWAP